MKKYHRDAIAWLKAQGATDVVLLQGRKHVRIYYTFAGRRRMQVTSTSPSDWRSLANFGRDFNRTTRG